MTAQERRDQAKPSLPQCVARVWERPWYIHNHACTRKAVMFVGGLPFCRQHAAMQPARGEVMGLP